MACSSTSTSTNLELLLVGRTGNGKSSSGNSILGTGSQNFPSKNSTTSVTKEVKRVTNEQKNVAVTDIPGLFDTEHDQVSDLSTAKENTLQAVNGTENGFHALLFVLKFDQRFTAEEEEAVSLIKSILGSDIFKDFGICVFTYGDNFESKLLDEGEVDGAKSFSEWCEKQTGGLSELFQECSSRYVLFDNKTKNPDKLNEQREVLLTMVQSLRQGQKTFGHAELTLASEREQKTTNISEKGYGRLQAIPAIQGAQIEDLELAGLTEEAQLLYVIAVSKVELELEIIREKFKKDLNIGSRDLALKKCLSELTKDKEKFENLCKRHGSSRRPDPFIEQLAYYQTELMDQI